MKTDQIEKTLLKRFSQPLPDCAERHIVFWYDDEAGFSDTVASLNLPDVKVWQLTGNNNFTTKELLEVHDLDSNYLIYAPYAKPRYDEDWLLDIFLYSQEFSADKTSVVMADLKISDLSLKESVKRNIAFFDNQERYNKIQSLPVGEWNESTLDLGMMAVACKLKTPDIEEIIKAVLRAGLKEEDNQLWTQIAKWPGVDSFWHYVRENYGYISDEPSLKKLFLSLALTAVESSVTTKVPMDWSPYLAGKKANCVVFVDHWMKDRQDSEHFELIANQLENELMLRQIVAKWNVEEYLECDVFSVFDKAIVLSIVNGLLGGSENYEHYLNMIQIRRTKHWYEKFKNIYLALEAAINLFKYKKQSVHSFAGMSARSMFEQYVKEFYLADQWYRQFYASYDDVAEDVLKNLQPRVENLYNHGILNPLSISWSDMVDAELSKCYSITGIAQQSNFYRENVLPILKRSDKEKVFVVISDGLRFEAAEELSSRLNRENKGTAELGSLQGVAPSYTKLGMASLLSWKQITLSEKGKILVDGKDSDGISQRQSILEDAHSQSLAVKWADIMDLSREAGRELVKPYRVIYIYHDVIDATGDKPATERNVFAAVEKALAELEKGVGKLVNSFNASNVLITADHGFLYARDALAECDKIGKHDTQAIDGNRRFMITRGNPDLPGTLAISLDYILGTDSDYYAAIPRAAQRFKIQGGGANYVHGGTLLQEIVIPLIKFKNTRVTGGKESTIQKVNVKLTNTVRKITNNSFNLDFFQTEPVSDKRLPRRLKVAMWDMDGGEKKISDEKILIAEKSSERADERTFKMRFLLKSGSYDRNKSYFLVLIDEELNLEYERVPFLINLGISNDFDDFS